MSDLPQTLCDGGCRRHWTVEWVLIDEDADKTVRWLLCEVHCEVNADLLHGLGFQFFERADVSA